MTFYYLYIYLSIYDFLLYIYPSIKLSDARFQLKRFGNVGYPFIAIAPWSTLTRLVAPEKVK